MLYTVCANVVRKHSNGSVSSHQVPTFFLSSQIQGIVSVEHVRQIALEVVNPTGQDDLTVHLHIEPFSTSFPDMGVTQA